MRPIASEATAKDHKRYFPPELIQFMKLYKLHFNTKQEINHESSLNAIIYLLNHYFNVPQAFTKLFSYCLSDSQLYDSIASSGSSTLRREADNENYAISQHLKKNEMLKSLENLIGIPDEFPILRLAWELFDKDLTISEDIIDDLLKFLKKENKGIVKSSIQFAFSLLSIFQANDLEKCLIEMGKVFGIKKEYIEAISLICGKGYINPQKILQLCEGPLASVISETIRIQEKQLSGLILLLYGEFTQEETMEFFRDLCERAKLDGKMAKYLINIMILWASKDTTQLLQAIRSLHLPCGSFLLLGKKILHPQHLLDSELADIGLNAKDDEILKDRNAVNMEDKEMWGNWKRDLTERLESDEKTPAKEEEKVKEEVKKDLSEETRVFQEDAPIIPKKLEENKKENLIEKKKLKELAKLLLNLDSLQQITPKVIADLLRYSDMILPRDPVEEKAILESAIKVLRIKDLIWYRQRSHAENCITFLSSELDFDAKGMRSIFNLINMTSKTAVVEAVECLFQKTATGKMNSTDLQKLLDFGKAIFDQSMIFQKAKQALDSIATYFSLPSDWLNQAMQAFGNPKAFATKSLDSAFLILDQFGFSKEAIDHISINSPSAKAEEKPSSFSLYSLRNLLCKVIIGDMKSFMDLIKFFKASPMLVTLFESLLTPNSYEQIVKIAKNFRNYAVHSHGIDTEHFNIIIALFIYLSNNGDKSINHWIENSENNEDAIKLYDLRKKQQTVYDYLGNKFGILPAALKCMEVGVKTSARRELIEELPKLINAINNLQNEEILNPHVISGIMALITGKTEISLEELSDQIGIKQEVIELCIRLGSISKSQQTSKTKLIEFCQSPTVLRAWKSMQLPVKLMEDLMNLSYNNYSLENLNKIISDLNLKSYVSDKMILAIASMIKSYLSVSNAINPPFKDAPQLKASENDMQVSIKPLCQALNLDPELVLVAIRLRQGEYTILEKHSNYLSSLLPNKMLRQAIMGCSGILTLPLVDAGIRKKIAASEGMEITNDYLTFESACEQLCDTFNINPLAYHLARFNRNAIENIAKKMRLNKMVLYWLLFEFMHLPSEVLKFIIYREHYKKLFVKKIQAESLLEKKMAEKKEEEKTINVKSVDLQENKEIENAPEMDALAQPTPLCRKNHPLSRVTTDPEVAIKQAQCSLCKIMIPNVTGYFICNICKTSFCLSCASKDKELADPLEIRCQLGHYIYFSTSSARYTTGQFFCDICGKNYCKCSDGRWNCGFCQLDICTNCIPAPGKEGGIEVGMLKEQLESKKEVEEKKEDEKALEIEFEERKKRISEAEKYFEKLDSQDNPLYSHIENLITKPISRAINNELFECCLFNDRSAFNFDKEYIISKELKDPVSNLSEEALKEIFDENFDMEMGTTFFGNYSGDLIDYSIKTNFTLQKNKARNVYTIWSKMLSAWNISDQDKKERKEVTMSQLLLFASLLRIRKKLAIDPQLKYNSVLYEKILDDIHLFIFAFESQAILTGAFTHTESSFSPSNVPVIQQTTAYNKSTLIKFLSIVLNLSLPNFIEPLVFKTFSQVIVPNLTTESSKAVLYQFIQNVSRQIRIYDTENWVYDPEKKTRPKMWKNNYSYYRYLIESQEAVKRGRKWSLNPYNMHESEANFVVQSIGATKLSIAKLSYDKDDIMMKLLDDFAQERRASVCYNPNISSAELALPQSKEGGDDLALKIEKLMVMELEKFSFLLDLAISDWSDVNNCKIILDALKMNYNELSLDIYSSFSNLICMVKSAKKFYAKTKSRASNSWKGLGLLINTILSSGSNASVGLIEDLIIVSHGVIDEKRLLSLANFFELPESIMKVLFFSVIGKNTAATELKTLLIHPLIQRLYPHDEQNLKLREDFLFAIVQMFMPKFKRQGWLDIAKFCAGKTKHGEYIMQKIINMIEWWKDKDGEDTGESQELNRNRNLIQSIRIDLDSNAYMEILESIITKSSSITGLNASMMKKGINKVAPEKAGYFMKSFFSLFIKAGRKDYGGLCDLIKDLRDLFIGEGQSDKCFEIVVNLFTIISDKIMPKDSSASASFNPADHNPKYMSDIPGVHINEKIEIAKKMPASRYSFQNYKNYLEEIAIKLANDLTEFIFSNYSTTLTSDKLAAFNTTEITELKGKISTALAFIFGAPFDIYSASKYAFCDAMLPKALIKIFSNIWCFKKMLAEKKLSIADLQGHWKELLLSNINLIRAIAEKIFTHEQKIIRSISNAKIEWRIATLTLKNYLTIKGYCGQLWSKKKKLHEELLKPYLANLEVPSFCLPLESLTPLLERDTSILPPSADNEILTAIITADIPKLMTAVAQSIPEAIMKKVNIIIKIVSMTEGKFTQIINNYNDKIKYVKELTEDLVGKVFASVPATKEEGKSSWAISSLPNSGASSLSPIAHTNIGEPEYKKISPDDYALIAEFVVFAQSIKFKKYMEYLKKSDILVETMNKFVHQLGGKKEIEFFECAFNLAFSREKLDRRTTNALIDSFVGIVAPNLQQEVNKFQALFDLSQAFYSLLTDSLSLHSIQINLPKLASELSLIFSCDSHIINLLMSLLQGDSLALQEFVAPICKLDTSLLNTLFTVFGDVKSKMASLTQILIPTVKRIRDSEKNTWMEMMKKVESGSAGVRELFNLVDMEGDSSGGISKDEFKRLLLKLHMNLSDHRITEIFAKVKKDERRSINELDVEEFEAAIKYVQFKRVFEGLNMLGLSQNQLIFLFVSLIIILVLLFAFIFLGINAFSLGGTFGSIINSMIPCIAGAGVAQRKPIDIKAEEWKEKLKEVAEEVTQIVGGKEG